MLLASASMAIVSVSAPRAAAPRFYADDPVTVDADMQFDASGARPLDLSEYYDFLENTFASRGDRTPIRALNVNTLEEVPDSSWFTNRIGRRPMSAQEIVRGPDRVERLEIEKWLIVRGKSPGGLQPGFLAVDPANPSQLYQLEVDPPANPEMATGAEVIGTAFYHALGYNVVDVYLVDVDPKRITISDKATIRDASGRRRFVQADLDAILEQGARLRDGRYRMSAGRFVEGEGLGNFKYYGTRPDDPNDIHPHEHRRELRANRVFAAWLNHDDSRAVNTLDMLVTAAGRTFIRHYMFDFGSILGSATRFADSPRSGHEYLLERGSSLAALLSLGLHVPPWLRRTCPDDLPPAVGCIDAETFEPARWKPEYPNAAFDNMRPDDAFWGARLVAAFSDEAIRAVVEKARFSDRRATDYLTDVLIERRDRIARAWLTAVNPVVNPRLSSEGTLTFRNAAVEARVATHPAKYAVAWSRFDNAAGTHESIAGEREVTATRAEAPGELLSGSEYIAATIRASHPEHPAWAQPVVAYFRRSPTGWTTVGLDRPFDELRSAGVLYLGGFTPRAARVVAGQPGPGLHPGFGPVRRAKFVVAAGLVLLARDCCRGHCSSARHGRHAPAWGAAEPSCHHDAWRAGSRRAGQCRPAPVSSAGRQCDGAVVAVWDGPRALCAGGLHRSPSVELARDGR